MITTFNPSNSYANNVVDLVKSTSNTASSSSDAIYKKVEEQRKSQLQTATHILNMGREAADNPATDNAIKILEEDPLQIALQSLVESDIRTELCRAETRQAVARKQKQKIDTESAAARRQELEDLKAIKALEKELGIDDN